jgi:hypothetical protein
MAKNEAAKIQRNTPALIWVLTQAPRAPASAWLATVATKIPRTMGQGFFEASRQQQRQELGFVADFGQGDDTR